MASTLGLRITAIGRFASLRDVKLPPIHLPRSGARVVDFMDHDREIALRPRLA
jgi:hypothetical protein